MFPALLTLPLFSSEGRLFEVENAMEEVVKGASCVAILAQDGIVVAAEQELMHPLMVNTFGHIFRVDCDNACAITGVMMDAWKFVKSMMNYSQRHQRSYGELMPTEQLVNYICMKKQSYTMYVGKQPFGIAVIYMGWDSNRGWQIYQSDPSGNYNGWQSVCIGRNGIRAKKFLDQRLVEKPLPTLEEALEVAIKTLKVAMNPRDMNSDTVQVVKMQRKDNETVYQILEKSVVDELCQHHCGTFTVAILEDIFQLI